MELKRQKGDRSQLCTAAPANKIENFREAFRSQVFCRHVERGISPKVKDTSLYLDLFAAMNSIWLPLLSLESMHVGATYVSAAPIHLPGVISYLWPQ